MRLERTHCRGNGPSWAPSFSRIMHASNPSESSLLQPNGNQDIVRVVYPQAARFVRAAVAELARSQAVNQSSGIPSALQKVSPRGAANFSCRAQCGLGSPRTSMPRYPNARATGDGQRSAPDQVIRTSHPSLTDVDRRFDNDTAIGQFGVHDHPGRNPALAPIFISLTLPAASNGVARSRAASDYLNNRPRILAHLMWISNALANMSRQEGLKCKLSDSKPLLNPVADAARALETRLTEKIGRETHQLVNVQRKLSLARTNQIIVDGKAGNFILQGNHILAARPCRIVHWQKMITSSAYRENNRKTKERFGNTNSARIESVLNQDITRLTAESRSILAQWCCNMESQKTVRSWSKDLRNIKRQISQMGLPRATSIEHRASI